jgi:hypothetical protein
MSGLNFEKVLQHAEPGEGARRSQMLDFEDYKCDAEIIATDARAVEITDAETLSLAVSIGGNAKKIIRMIDVRRKAIIFEPSEFIDTVNGICRMITDDLKEAAKITGEKVTQYQARIEMGRRNGSGRQGRLPRSYSEEARIKRLQDEEVKYVKN